MDKFITLAVMLTSFVSLTGFLAIIPYISRKTLSFGISIPEKAYYEDEVILIRKKYRNLTIVTGSIFIAIIISMVYFTDLDSNTAALILGISISSNLIADGYIYLRAYWRMKRLKAERKWGEDVRNLVTVNTNYNRKNTVLNPLWFIAYIIIIGATVAISLALFDSLPDRIPMQYNMAGEVIRYASKTYGTIFSMPVTQVFITFIFIFVYYSISKSKQQIDPANPKKTFRQSVIFRKRWSAYLIFTGLFMLLLFGAIQLSILGVISYKQIIAGPLIFVFLLIIIAAVLAATTGQSGSKVRIADDKGGDGRQKATILRDDDKHWKWGAFYYNPDDPSIFVEKRFGIGWTVNFGRPLSWIILFGILVIIAGFTLLITFMSGA